MTTKMKQSTKNIDNMLLVHGMNIFGMNKDKLATGVNVSL